MIKNFIPTVKRLMSLIIVRLFNCFPIKQNKVFFFSYYGSQYGCSPKYITEYILKNCPGKEFDLVWAFNDIESKAHLQGFRKVKTMSVRFFYELCTSKVIITNFRTTEFFKKRKGQYYIQTWHSSLRLKKIEKDTESTLPKKYIKMAIEDSKKCDLLLSGCKMSTEIFKRAFWYDGKYFEHGTPRNDILFQNNTLLKEQIRRRLNISPNSKVVLYAPTFRKNNNLDVYNMDYEKAANNLSQKFGGKWTVLVKLHPHLMAKSNQLLSGCNVTDVTTYDDIQELLFISDVLITDYSSVMFDFALTRRPCFLYAPDIVDYINNDRQMYFDITRLPFPCSVNDNDLAKKIAGFDETEYKYQLEKFLDKIGSFEKGNACEMLVKHIYKICFDKEGSEMYEKV